ncbi:hypothetical protein [Parasphingorhabdus sp.]|uniref:hypothetical protein n=1 Tax=Parasphingorhabdus sp. TaxID=2709688 RepID=UPI003266E76A
MLSYLLYFPSITFGLLTAEIFPWALIYCLFYLRRLDNATLLFVGILSLSAFATGIYGNYFLESQETDVLRSFAAYLNIFLIFVCILNLDGKNLEAVVKAGKVSFFGLLIIGIMQNFALLQQVSDAISFLVPRATGSALTEMGDRGVTLLSSEPARAGIELTFLYLLFRLGSQNQRGFVIWDLLLLAYILLIIKAASAVFFCGLVIILISVKKPTVWLLWLAGIGGLFLLPTINIGGRFVILISSLEQFSTLDDLVFFLANEAGHRLLALYAFIVGGLMNPIGFGIGNWQEASVIALEASGLPYYEFRYFIIYNDGLAFPVRAPGVIPNLMLDIGVLGILVFAYWLYSQFSNRELVGSGQNRFIILFILLVKITLFGSLGNPVPWVVAAACLRLSKNADLVEKRDKLEKSLRDENMAQETAPDGTRAPA